MEDYIIASNKGGEVYRFGFFFQLHLLTDIILCRLDILVNWLQIILLSVTVIIN